MSNYKDKYTLGKGLGQGGFAEVYVATAREGGETWALKRLKKEAKWNVEAIPRMRREIDVQQALEHRNIMPIVDYDDGDEPTWFTMPIADYTVVDRRKELVANEADLVAMIDDVVSALGFAHDAGHVHRDVAPQNILFLEDRWVLADWGLVRRPLGETTTALTNDAIGHVHYMAPEMMDDPHAVTGAADVYSLGRILMYVFSGRHPNIMTPELPTGAWRRVVAQLAHPDPTRRPAIDDVPALIASSLRSTKTSLSRIQSLIRTASSDPDDMRALVEALANLPSERQDEVYVDLLPNAPVEMYRAMLSAFPEDAALLAGSVRRHVESSNWNGRNFDTLNQPLGVLLTLATEAHRARAYDLLGRISEQLFELDVSCDRYRSRDNVREWLVRLRGRSAQTVADVLVRVKGAVDFYGRSWSPTGADPAIADALGS